ncbi:MAG: hypothetical protein Q9227_006746 [Pyrenula ochraceoflavens]
MPSLIDPIDLSWRSSWAHHAILKQISKSLTVPTGRETDIVANLPFAGVGDHPVDERHIPSLSDEAPKLTNNDPLTVAIVGAGCAGLFVPMIFKELKLLLQKEGHPDLIFDFFTKELKMPYVPELKADTPAGSLIPYIYTAPNQPSYFNDIQYLGNPTKVNPYNIPDIPSKLMEVGPGKLLADDVSYFTNLLNKDPKSGWEKLIEYDNSSVRQFFYQPFTWINEKGEKQTRPAYDYKTVEWLETFNSGTRWFDQAFSETVLEEAVFDPDKPWWCIMGGTQQVAQKMLAKIMEDSPHTKISYNSLVTAIGIDSGSPTPDSKGRPDITVGGKTRSYDSVFNSVPLGCMRRMDLRKLPLTYGTKQALRSLNYGASTKVGMRFKNMWWRNGRFNIQGGLGKTDLPLRVCVYPSYNLEDPPEKGGVLLCSYCWAQDADRTGALIDNDASDKDKTQKLQDMLVHNLTLLHCRTGDKEDYEHVRKMIMGEDNTNLQEIHAFDWTRNELSTGAFAWFGPGQFTNMFPDIVCTDSRHIIIGELASAHHAWIVGALESAVRGVYMFLYMQAQKGHEGCAAALKLYEDNKVPSPYGPVPPEYNRSTYMKDLNDESVEKPVVGELAKILTILESNRLETEAAAAA